MAVMPGDIKYYLSTLTGGKSLGGTADAAVSCGTALNCFDLVTGSEGVAGTVDYRCLFVKNDSAQTAYDVHFYIPSQVAGGAAITGVGVDTNAAATFPGTSVTIANELTAPTGVTFTLPTTDVAGVVIGDLLAGQCRAVWLRRQAATGAPVAADGAGVQSGFDTDP